QLPTYRPPTGAFTPGGNGVGVIHAVGRDVWHLKSGQRVVLSSHFVAAENVPEPAQIPIGVTSFGGAGEAVQADWHQVAHLLLPRQHSAPEHIEPPTGNTHPGPNPLYLTGSTERACSTPPLAMVASWSTREGKAREPLGPLVVFQFPAGHPSSRGRFPLMREKVGHGMMVWSLLSLM